MQGRKEAFSLQILQLIDVVLVWSGFYLAFIFRDPIRMMMGLPPMGAEGLAELGWLVVALLPATVLTLEMFGYYRRPLQKARGTSMRQMLQAGVVLGCGVAVVLVFFQITPGSRLILGLGAPVAAGLLFVREGLYKQYLRKLALKVENKERVLLAGHPQDMDELLDELPDEEKSIWNIVGRYDLGTMDADDLRTILIEKSVERVVVSAKQSEFQRVAEAVEICELQGIEAWISAGFIRTQIARPAFDSLGTMPMLVLRSTPELSWSLLLKGVMDRGGALILLIATSPLWLLAAIGIRLSSPGAPVFFTQERAGRYGKPFRMIKFRTMVADAEARLLTLKENKGNEMDGPVFKLERDPRVFAFGRWLRRFSIDELPQLWNVLRGEMSLVGPRPLPIYEVKAFEEAAHRRRLSVKPGLTCLWQVKGRNEITSFQDWVDLDLEYIDNWSFWLDIRILLLTVPAVLLAKGAK